MFNTMNSSSGGKGWHVGNHFVNYLRGNLPIVDHWIYQSWCQALFCLSRSFIGAFPGLLCLYFFGSEWPAFSFVLTFVGAKLSMLWLQVEIGTSWREGAKPLYSRVSEALASTLLAMGALVFMIILPFLLVWTAQHQTNTNLFDLGWYFQVPLMVMCATLQVLLAYTCLEWVIAFVKLSQACVHLLA